jgi:long-chain acyl-CoA synthetase
MLYPYKELDSYTLPALLQRSVKLYADKDALGEVGKQPYTYAQLGQKVKELIKILESHKIQKGDKVVLLSQNMPNWPIAYFAITSIGAVVVPILPDFHISDVTNIIKDCEAKAIITSQKYLAGMKEAAHKDINFILELDSLPLTQSCETSLNDYIKNYIVDENDLASLLYTSGTTGHSKGVMLSHKNLVTNALSTYKHLKITPEDSFLSILPLAHTFECTVGMSVPLLHGASIYYIDKTPTPSVLLKAFAIQKPTMMLSVPLVIEKIYKTRIEPQFKKSFLIRTLYKVPFVRKKLHKIAGKKLLESFGGKIKFFGIGGAPLSRYVEEFLIEAEFPYVIGYGLTETSPLISGTLMYKPQRLGSCGVAMVGVDIKIAKEHEDDPHGEIMVRSPSVMLGYYKEPAKTAEVMNGEWFLTGDLGHIDKDGYLFISGRSKNVIISASGENIYPEPIEATFNQHKMVADTLIIEKGSQLIAKIHLDYALVEKEIKYSVEQLLQEILEESNKKLSNYTRVSKAIEQKEPFIKTPTKKIKRYLYTE